VIPKEAKPQINPANKIHTLPHKLSTLVEQLAIDERLPAGAHIADEIPVYGAAIHPPDIRKSLDTELLYL
jgi:hypothetical protein